MASAINPGETRVRPTFAMPGWGVTVIALFVLAAAVAGGVVIGTNLSSETSAAPREVVLPATHPPALITGVSAPAWPSILPSEKPSEKRWLAARQPRLGGPPWGQ